MTDLGPTHPNYIPSSILSKKIKKYHDSAKTLLPELKKYDWLLIEIDNEQPFQNAFKDVYSKTEPTVIHVRSGGSSNELRKEIVNNLID